MGATFSVAVIESSHYWIGMIAAPWLALCGFSHSEGVDVPTRLQCPLRGLAVWMAVGLVLGLAIYRCIVGSFTEPSELGGIFTIAKNALHL
jgi:hypothetical protein